MWFQAQTFCKNEGEIELCTSHISSLPPCTEWDIGGGTNEDTYWDHMHLPGQRFNTHYADGSIYHMLWDHRLRQQFGSDRLSVSYFWTDRTTIHSVEIPRSFELELQIWNVVPINARVIAFFWHTIGEHPINERRWCHAKVPLYTILELRLNLLHLTLHLFWLMTCQNET